VTIADEAEIGAVLDGLKHALSQLQDPALSPRVKEMIAAGQEDEIERLRMKVLPRRKPSGTYVAPVIRLVKR
jgi:hypothetical protein